MTYVAIPSAAIELMLLLFSILFIYLCWLAYKGHRDLNRAMKPKQPKIKVPGWKMHCPELDEFEMKISDTEGQKGAGC